MEGKLFLFDDIKIGRPFIFNGTSYNKRSNRTANVFGMPSRWFYFSKKDVVYSHPNNIKGLEK